MALNAAIAERKILPHFYSMATIQCPIPIYHLLQEGKQTVVRLSLRYRPLSGIHRKITKGCLDFINAIL